MMVFNWRELVRLLMIAVVVVLIFHGPDSRADKPLNKQIAQKHYELGERLYKTSDYSGALSNFVKAYKLAPLPAMLFNIARCHEVMGHRREAIKYYLLYLEKLPRARNVPLVEMRIVNLTMQENTRKPVKGGGKGEATDRDAPSIPSALLVAQPRPVKLTWRSTAGVVCLAVGGASMITGVIFGAMARSRADEFKIGVDQQAEYYFLEPIDDEGKQFETIQTATLVAGGAVIAAGLALLLWDRLAGSARTERPVISPFATDKTLGVSGQIRF